MVSVDEENFSITNGMNTETFKVKDFHMKCLVGYATTIHKSQGDTVEGQLNIFDCDFITSKWLEKRSAKKDDRRALYTALSRARKLSDIKICS